LTGGVRKERSLFWLQARKQAREKQHVISKRERQRGFDTAVIMR
jgi:hypothetical protein